MKVKQTRLTNLQEALASMLEAEFILHIGFRVRKLSIQDLEMITDSGQQFLCTVRMGSYHLG